MAAGGRCHSPEPGVPEFVIEPFSGDEKPMATRAASGKVIAQVASQVPLLIGGSADLTPSNNTRPEGWDDFQPGSYAGRYLRFGVREHGMSAIANGLAASGMRPYVATFFNFLDYAQAVGAALGPSRASGRSGSTPTTPSGSARTARPTSRSSNWQRCAPRPTCACFARPTPTRRSPGGGSRSSRDLPTALILTRQALAVLDPGRYPVADAARGGYVLEGDDGSRRHPDRHRLGGARGPGSARAPARSRRLAAGSCRCRRGSSSRSSRSRTATGCCPPEIEARVSVEAAATLGWERYVGLHGAVIGLDRFGASAPGATVLKNLGFTPERVADEAERVLQAASIPSGGQRGDSES